MVLTLYLSFPLSISSPYLEELHSDTSEHELQQRGDDHDVADGPDSHKHTLDHVLQRTHSYTLLEGIHSTVNSHGKLVRHVQMHTATCCVIVILTFSPLALLMALSGRRTLKTRRIFTTEIAEDLWKTEKHTNKFRCAISRHVVTEAFL